MRSPVTTFFYVLMRDHLPTGTVKFLIDQAQRAGDPSYSSPELEQLAERYAKALLEAPPRDEADGEDELPPAPARIPAGATGDDNQSDTGDQPDRQPEPEEPEPKESRKRDRRRIGHEVVDRTREFLRGREKVFPGELDVLGYSSSTRARVIKELRKEGFITGISYEGRRRTLLIRQDDESQPAGEAFKNGEKLGDLYPLKEPEGGGALEQESVSEHLEQTAAENIGDLNGTAGETRKPSGSALVNLVGSFLDHADGEVWPNEIETRFGISALKRREVVNELLEEGRLVVVGANGPRVRYRSTKVARPSASPRSPGVSEAAEPLGAGPTALRDPTPEKRAEAKAEQEAIDAAMERLDDVKAWCSGAGTFRARQVQEVFEFTPAAVTRICAQLVKDDFLEHITDKHGDGVLYRVVPSNGNGNGRRFEGRTLPNRPPTTIEGTVLASLQGGGLTLEQTCKRVGQSEEVIKQILGKLWREGDIRPQTTGGERYYIAV